MSVKIVVCICLEVRNWPVIVGGRGDEENCLVILWARKEETGGPGPRTVLFRTGAHHLSGPLLQIESAASTTSLHLRKDGLQLRSLIVPCLELTVVEMSLHTIISIRFQYYFGIISKYENLDFNKVLFIAICIIVKITSIKKISLATEKYKIFLSIFRKFVFYQFNYIIF